jgi:hypothetical protein
MSSTIIGALVAGAICGLVPLIYGLTRGQTALAVGGFVACVIGGLLLGVILAVPLAALFAYLIWRQGRTTTAPTAGTTTAAPPAAGAGEERFDRDPARDREPTARP